MFFHECSSVAWQPACRQPCGVRPCLSRALGLSVGARCLPRPLHKGTAKAFLTGEAAGLRHALDGQVAAVQQVQGAVAAQLGGSGDNPLRRGKTVVLLDLKLPRIDGLEVLRRIRADQRTALLPVVVLTTSREPLDLAQAYRLGANSYIRKPVDFDRFERAIGLIGHYWLELNETTETVARGAY